MGQITSGIRSILSYPLVYAAFQAIMGAHSSRKNFVECSVRPFPGLRILDVGCGPADILAYLPKVCYHGFDISQDYINQARKRFTTSGEFHCKIITSQDIDELEPFDIVLAIGLMHHLDDNDALAMLKLAKSALKPGGRLLTIDPCYDPSQNPVARFLIRGDRGQHVRDRVGYTALAGAVFDNINIEVRHRSWIPYTHCLMECIS